MKETLFSTYFLDRWKQPAQISPDGVRYLYLAEGNRTVFPFQHRWLMPKICKTEIFRWRVVTDICSLLFIPFMGAILFLHGASLVACISGALSITGLAGIFTFNRKYPILVDAPAFMLLLLSYIFFLLGGYWYWGFLGLSILSGCIKESGPLYLIGLTLDPFAAVGFLSPLLIKIFIKEGENPDSVKHLPGIDGSLSYVADMRTWRDPKQLLLPWGGLVSAALFPSTQLLVSLFLGYAPMIKVTDTVRIFQWASPAVIIAVFTNIPDYACLPLLLTTIFNPYRSNGG